MDDRRAVVIDLASPQVTAVSDANPDSFLLAISPRGSAVAVYDGGTGLVHIIGQLPQTPQVVQEFDASTIAGQPNGLAVSDDGSLLLLRFVDPNVQPGLWLMTASGTVHRLQVDEPSGVAFFAGGHDVVVGDDATASASIILDVGQTETQILLVAGVDGMASFSSIATSDDRTKVFLGDGKSGNVAVVDVSSGRPAVVSCGCQVTGLSRLRGNDVFRLNDASADPINVLDVSGSGARVVLVPPKLSDVSREPQ